MESYVVHFDRPADTKASFEPTGIVEDMRNRVQNTFKNTQELMLLLGQFDNKDYPWQQQPVKKATITRIK